MYYNYRYRWGSHDFKRVYSYPFFLLLLFCENEVVLMVVGRGNMVLINSVGSYAHDYSLGSSFILMIYVYFFLNFGEHWDRVLQSELVERLRIFISLYIKQIHKMQGGGGGGGCIVVFIIILCNKL